MSGKVRRANFGLFLGCLVLLGVFQSLLAHTADGGRHAVNGFSGSGEAVILRPLMSHAIYLPVIAKTEKESVPVFAGDLGIEDLIIRSLEAGTHDLWSFFPNQGDTISVMVAPGNMVDITLSIRDSDDKALIDKQNLSPAGEAETISNLVITKPGKYKLIVHTVPGWPTDYALMLLDQDSYNYVFRGTLANGDVRTESLDPNTDVFWFFQARSDEKISFSVIPAADEDPYLELYDPDGVRVLTIDDTGSGETESLENYMLLEGGLYSIRVAEFDFQAMNYEITFSKP